MSGAAVCLRENTAAVKALKKCEGLLTCRRNPFDLCRGHRSNGDQRSQHTRRDPPGPGRLDAISERRRLRSRSRARRRSRQIALGLSAGNRDQSGSVFRTAANVSDTVSPPSNWRPVSISYNTAPNAQMSARRSTGLPRACSGDIYAVVPRIHPARVGTSSRSGS